MAKVLVTGATGFVGKRLIYSLLERGHTVYALVRIAGTMVFPEEKEGLYHIWGDLRDPQTFTKIPQDIDAAYYLVHSMSEMVRDLEQMEQHVAECFVEALKGTHAKQIIYLGGIINNEKDLSSHLQSRLIVERILRKSGISCTILRASIIIGAGSASFEIIRDLTEKLPVMIAPKWLRTPCQPIAIQDVLFYLTNVLLHEACYNKVFDIGGPEVLTFKALLLEYAAYRKLTRYIFDVPVLTPHLSSLWLLLITSVKFSICYYLVASITSSSVVRLKEIQTIIPHQCLSYQKALELAFQNISQNEVVSTWMDSWELEGTKPSIANFIQVPKEGCLKDVQQVALHDSKENVISRIWQIGGDRGYYSMNWAWKLRGLIDKLVGGVGLNRGRRDPTELSAGDSVDFWRVLLADKEAGHLILFAGMKVPGDAWLEFAIENGNLVQTATFRPKGLLGRLYWYAMLPFHYFIFRNMAKALADA